MNDYDANQDLDQEAAAKVMGWHLTTRGAIDSEEQSRAWLGDEYAKEWCAEPVYIEPGARFYGMLINGPPYTQDGCHNAFHPSCYLCHARMLLDRRAEQGYSWAVQYNCATKEFHVCVGDASGSGTNEALTITRVATWMKVSAARDLENELG